MSTVAIVGGHGKIGLLATRDLTAAGHVVRSVIRKPEQRADVESVGGVPVELDVEASTVTELAEALGPVDAIIFTAGAGEGSTIERKETVDYQAAVKSLGAAVELGVRRFVLVSYLSADVPGSAGSSPSSVAYQRAKAAADDAVRASDLDWTIVRPGTLNDELATELVTIDEAITTGTTSRGNVAALLAELATSVAAVRQVLNVIDGATPIAEAV